LFDNYFIYLYLTFNDINKNKALVVTNKEVNRQAGMGRVLTQN